MTLKQLYWAFVCFRTVTVTILWTNKKTLVSASASSQIAILNNGLYCDISRLIEILIIGNISGHFRFPSRVTRIPALCRTAQHLDPLSRIPLQDLIWLPHYQEKRPGCQHGAVLDLIKLHTCGSHAGQPVAVSAAHAAHGEEPQSHKLIKADYDGTFHKEKQVQLK